jgi:DNA-directed RNA polymerase specialized sigma24 family protein
VFFERPKKYSICSSHNDAEKKHSWTRIATSRMAENSEQRVRQDSEDSGRSGQFRTTHWSVVLHARGGTPDSPAALERLCRAYWHPLYTFIRRRGHSEHEAQDLTQEFFARFLAADSLQGVSADKGRFRTFLLAALKNFLASEWRDANRLKRGGGREFISYDEFSTEEGAHIAPASTLAPEVLFDLRWARSLLATSVGRLEREMKRDGLADRFAALMPFLQGQAGAYADAGKKVGLSEAAVTSAIFRMRRRYAEILRDEVSQTVASPDEVEGEIRYLISVLSVT